MAMETFDAVVVIGVDLNLEPARCRAHCRTRDCSLMPRRSSPAIFAGDVASTINTHSCIVGLAQNQAIATAKAMLDPQASGYDEAPWLWSDHDRNIQIRSSGGQPHHRA